MKIIKRLLIGLLALVVIISVGMAGVAYYLHTPVSDERLVRMKQSSLFQDGAFVNVEPQAATEITWDFLKEQFFGEQKREPDGIIPVVQVEPEEFKQPASQELKATWYGHATVLVELEGKRVFVDPVFFANELIVLPGPGDITLRPIETGDPRSLEIDDQCILDFAGPRRVIMRAGPGEEPALRDTARELGGGHGRVH